MSKPLITEIRQVRGLTKTQATARRAAAHDRARTCIARLNADLEGQHPEFVIEVFRALVRAIGSSLAQRAGTARSVGVLVGALTAVSPAWRSDAAAALADAESLFGDAA